METVKGWLSSNLEFFVICIIPVIILVIILVLCKKYNFSLLPKGLRGKRLKKKHKNMKFDLPEFSRKKMGNKYVWSARKGDDYLDDDYEIRKNMYDQN